MHWGVVSDEVTGANLEIVRRAAEAAIKKKWTMAMAALDPSIELDQARPTGAYHGVSGVKSAVTRWSEVWTDHRVEIEELIDAGDEIIVIAHEYASTARTGTPMDRRLFQVWTLEDSRVVSIREYSSRNEALIAAGLPGSGG
jgi:hypothetical protein